MIDCVGDWPKRKVG